MTLQTLRIISDNAADRATIVVPNTASGMGASKLKTDYKGEVCRVLSSTATITCTWPNLETLAAVIIPASNLGPSSTIRVRAYLNSDNSSLIADSGVKYAAPGEILENWDFQTTLNVNFFADGISPIVACYLPEHVAARKVVIDITNPDNSFIDLSRLVIGKFLAPKYNADYGQTDTLIDLSVNTRASSGDLKTDWGPKAIKKSFDLAWINDADRANVTQLMHRGIGRWIFVSLCPENDDPVLERDKSIYGKLTQPTSMGWSKQGLHSASFEIEGY